MSTCDKKYPIDTFIKLHEDLNTQIETTSPRAHNNKYMSPELAVLLHAQWGVRLMKKAGRAPAGKVRENCRCNTITNAPAGLQKTLTLKTI